MPLHEACEDEAVGPRGEREVGARCAGAVPGQRRRADEEADELGDDDKGAEFPRAPMPLKLAQRVEQRDADDELARARESKLIRHDAPELLLAQEGAERERAQDTPRRACARR